jgi:hypothetical protein
MSPTLVFAQQVMTPSAPERRMTPEWACNGPDAEQNVVHFQVKLLAHRQD